MKIFVVHSNKCFHLDIGLGLTIGELKVLIKDAINIKFPIEHFYLKYNYKILSDDSKTINEYNIRNNSFLQFINCFDEASIKLKFKDEVIEMNNFPCFCCYSILDYKKKINEKRGYPIECQIFYSDEKTSTPLNDNDYESTPILLKIDDKYIENGYKVKYFDGAETYNIAEGDELENIKEIKQKIEAEYKLPSGSFELLFDGNVLNDNKKLSDYNIFFQSIIYIVIEQKYEHLLLNKLFNHSYFLISYKGRSYSAGLEYLTIFEIKKYFSEIILKDIKIDKIKIIYRGKILDNNFDIKKEGLSGRKLELVISDN